jgi:hypothetical protein
VASVLGVSPEAVVPLLTRIATDDVVAGSTTVLAGIVMTVRVLARASARQS